jgi:hypothetical protein
MVAPGADMRIGAWVATMNCDPLSTPSFIMARSANWLWGDSAASGSSIR